MWLPAVCLNFLAFSFLSSKITPDHFKINDGLRLLPRFACRAAQQVYDLVVIKDKPINPVFESQPAIIRTCRTTRVESLRIYYCRNSFALHDLYNVRDKECTCGSPHLGFMRCSIHGRDLAGRRWTKWAPAIRPTNVQNISNLRIKGYSSDIRLYQDGKRGILDLQQGTKWKSKRNAIMSKHGLDECQELRRLSRGIMDRKIQPGLSLRAVEKIVSYVDQGYKWYGLSEEEVEKVLSGELLRLVRHCGDRSAVG